MTWPPKTWVDGDTPSGDDLNDHLRDPLNDLSAHIHDGSAGQGSNEITPDKVTLADQGASPSAAGELQRDGVNLEWYGAAVVAITEVDPGVGTAGPRTLGTGPEQAAAGDHTHPLTGDADVGDVKSPKTFYKDDMTTRLTGTMPTEAIVAGNDAYAAGYHAGNVGGLDAIDTDLATANIKSGITIFGKAGSTNVRDSSDADVVAGEVRTGRTFYAGGGARKTGTGTKTLSPANDTVTAGYYAATTLDAIDTDLATANIKSGITIFGKAGSTNVRDSTDADAVASDVFDTKTFYAGGGARKTGSYAQSSSGHSTTTHAPASSGGAGGTDGGQIGFYTVSQSSTTTLYNITSSKKISAFLMVIAHTEQHASGTQRFIAEADGVEVAVTVIAAGAGHAYSIHIMGVAVKSTADINWLGKLENNATVNRTVTIRVAQDGAGGTGGNPNPSCLQTQADLG